MDVPQPHMAELGGLLLRAGLAQRAGGLLGRHAHAVVAQVDQHVAGGGLMRDGQRDATRAALGLDAVEDGVFHQRLQRKAGDIAGLGQALVLDVSDVQRDGAAVAVLLDGKVIVEQGKLLLQRHQPLVALGDALQQPRKRHRHLGDAGRVLDGGHPLDAVERVVDKVRVDLVLQHAVFQVFFLQLVVQALLHQRRDRLRKPVDAAADVAHLVVPLNGRVGRKIAPADALQLRLQRLHRRGDHMPQQQRQHGAQQQNGGQGPQKRHQHRRHLAAQRGGGQRLRHIHAVGAQRVGQHKLVAIGVHPRLGVQQLQGCVPGRGKGGGVRRLQRAAVQAPYRAVHAPKQRTALGQGVVLQRVGDQPAGHRQVDHRPARAGGVHHRARHGDDLPRLVLQQRVVGQHRPGGILPGVGKARQHLQLRRLQRQALRHRRALLHHALTAVGHQHAHQVARGILAGVFV